MYSFPRLVRFKFSVNKWFSIKNGSELNSRRNVQFFNIVPVYDLKLNRRRDWVFTKLYMFCQIRNIPRPAPVTRIRFPSKLMFMTTNVVLTIVRCSLLNVFILPDPTNDGYVHLYRHYRGQGEHSALIQMNSNFINLIFRNVIYNNYVCPQYNLLFP